MRNIQIKGDLSRIIKNFSYAENAFYIEYFDGSCSQYICNDPEHAQIIKDIMYNQALNRQKDLSTINFDKNEMCLLLAQIFNALGIGYATYKDSSFLLLIVGILTGINIMEFIRNTAARKEFEKYLIFFELSKNKEVVNDSKFMECIEGDHLYQKHLDIDTVDDFTLGELRTLKRKLNENKNRN